MRVPDKTELIRKSLIILRGNKFPFFIYLLYIWRLNDSLWQSKTKLTSLILIPIFIMALIMVIVMIFSSRSYIDRDFSEINHSEVLKVVTDYNSIGYFVSGDTFAGFNYELLKAIENYAGVTVEIEVENDMIKCIQGLKDGKFDIIARNIPVNANLKNHISFTTPIIRNKLVLIQKAPDNDDQALVKSHLDLAKDTIYVPKGSPAVFRIANLSAEIGDTIYMCVDSLYEIPQLVMKVAGGDIKYTVSDVATARLMKEHLPEIDIDTDIGFTHLEAWGVRNTAPELLDSLNEWISRIQDREEFMVIYNKYYNFSDNKRKKQ